MSNFMYIQHKKNCQFSLHQSQNKKLINFQNSLMEPEPTTNINNIMQMLANTNNWTIINSVLSFLSHQQIEAIADIGLSGHSTRLFKTAMAKTFMDKYLNRVDRSVFFVFYEEDQFRDIEKHTINLLAHNHYQFLAHSLTQYKQLLTSFSNNTTFLASHAELQALLQQILFQPQLPMPKLKRQTIGMFCQSPFQEFLSMIRFPSDEQLWMAEPLQELRDILEKELIELLQQHVYGVQSSEEIKKKIRQVRFSGYKINYHNWRNYLIQNFKMHNIIVLLLALCSQTVNTYSHFIENIQDPFMKFISFSLRSNIYRNIVLTIEDQFKFLFRIYTQFYEESYESSTLYPPLSFWIPSLSIWVQQMEKFHPNNLTVYNYITAKLRENSLKQFLIIKTEKLPSFFSELKQEIEFQSYSQIRKNKVYQNNENVIEAESFFQNNYEMYQTLSKDYIEYMVDISLNQYSVHWCGHSQHIITKYPLFKHYYQNVVSEMLELHTFILDIISRSVPKEIRLNIFKQVVKEDLQFCDVQLFKPVVTKTVVNTLNKWIKDMVEEMQNYAVFDEQGFSKNKIIIDFQQKDAILKYFASKSYISQDCPEERSFFYNIQIEDIDPVFLKEIEEDYEDLESMEQYISDEGQIDQDQG